LKSGNLKPTSTESVRLIDWFLLNLKIGALSFGGSARLLMYQDYVVDRKKWMSPEEFQEMFTIIQVLPGPNLVNLCVYLGYLLTNPLHAILGLLALAVPGTVIAVSVISFVNFQNFHVASFFQGLSIASVGLFTVFVWRLRHGIVKASRRKLILRIAIILAVMLSVFASVRLDFVLIAAIPACLLVEFLV
jgi:chromate transporter